MTGIYRITSPNKRVYIGQAKSIKKRFKDYHYSLAKGQPKLNRSFLKYGIDNHKFEVVCYCDIDELNNLERYYQEIFNCVKNGLNCEFVNSENSPKERSQEVKDKIGAYQRTRKMTDETCLKISKSRKGIVFTDEHRENIRISKTGQNNKRSKVVLDLNSGVFFDSIAEASYAYNIDHRTLSRYLNGTRTNKTNLISV